MHRNPLARVRLMSSIFSQDPNYLLCGQWNCVTCILKKEIYGIDFCTRRGCLQQRMLQNYLDNSLKTRKVSDTMPRSGKEYELSKTRSIFLKDQREWFLLSIVGKVVAFFLHD